MQSLICSMSCSCLTLICIPFCSFLLFVPFQIPLCHFLSASQVAVFFCANTFHPIIVIYFSQPLSCHFIPFYIFILSTFLFSFHFMIFLHIFFFTHFSSFVPYFPSIFSFSSWSTFPFSCFPFSSTLPPRLTASNYEPILTPCKLGSRGCLRVAYDGYVLALSCVHLCL